MAVPEAQRWLFWDVDPAQIDVERDRRYVLGRVLERGRWVDVTWAVTTYGERGILAFFKTGGHPELSKRTLSFWEAYFRTEENPCPNFTTSRPSNNAPWIE
jgi:squalene cyclase